VCIAARAIGDMATSTAAATMAPNTVRAGVTTSLGMGIEPSK